MKLSSNGYVATSTQNLKFLLKTGYPNQQPWCVSSLIYMKHMYCVSDITISSKPPHYYTVSYMSKFDEMKLVLAR